MTRMPYRFDYFTSQRSTGFILLLAVIALLGPILILFPQAGYGPNITYDSISYIVMARNLLDGQGLLNWAGRPEASWPPGYPILLSLFSFSFFDPIQIAGPLNAIAMGLTVFLVGYWLMRRVESRFLILWACLVLVFAYPLWLIAYSVWSETAFILFVILSLIWMDKYLVSGKRSSLIIAAVFTAFALLTRYAGISLVITTLILLILQRRLTPQEKTRRIGLFIAISTTPLALWLIRNILHTGTLAGRRFPSETSLSDNLQLVLNTLAHWWQPTHHFKTAFQLVSGPATAGALVVLTMLVSYTLILWWRNPDKHQNESFVLVTGIFAFVYLCFMLWIASNIKILHPLNYRLLSPAYIPLLILIVYATDQFIIHCCKQNYRGSLASITRTIPILILFALSLWVSFAGYSTILNAKTRLISDGIGYKSKIWRESQTLKHLEEYTPAWIYSNAPYVIYINYDRAHASSHIYGFLPSKKDILAKRIVDVYAKQEYVYIVWFYVHSENKRYNYDASHLTNLRGLEILAELADGVILRVIPEQEN